MSLTTTEKMLHDAQQGHYAVAAFNAENLEMIQAILAAAEEAGSPVIVQTTPKTLAYAAPPLFFGMVSAACRNLSVPAALHLDHGNSVELCRLCADAGYTSIMFDGSALPFDENIARTKEVAAYSAAKGLPVEAELGAIGGKEDAAEASLLLTDPHDAEVFAHNTGISSLAVAIGTAHGFYKSTPHLDYARLAQIRSVVSVPLVLHGASGLSAESIRQAISLGICKVNFATELRVAYTAGVRGVLQDAAVYDPKKYGAAGKDAVRKLVLDKIAICGSAGKARAV